MEERDRLILRILYETGCTVKELVGLRYSDVDFAGRAIHISRKSARSGPRNVYVSAQLLDAIREYKHKNPSPYLLSTRQSNRMTRKRVRQIVQGLLGSAGFAGHGPQTIRYTHIVHAYSKGIPLPAIQRQVGLGRSRAIEIFSQLPNLETGDAYSKFLE